MIGVMRLERCCCAILTTCFIIHLLMLSKVFGAQNTLYPGEQLLGAGSFLESSNKYFRLTFIQRPWTQESWYLAIVCMNFNPPIAVWVTFPNVSLSESPVALTMESQGTLRLWGYLPVIFVNADQPAMVPNTTATLLDNANLVLTAPDGRTLWQSFDYPTNTWLPGMKLGLFGFNLNTRQPRKRFLTSWMSDDNPSPGAFTLELTGSPLDPSKTVANSNGIELVAMRRGMPYWRSGEWNGKNFRYFSWFDFLGLTEGFDVHLSYFFNESESYFSWNFSHDKYTLIRLEANGIIYLLSMNYSSNRGFAAACDEGEVDRLIFENNFVGNDTGCTTPEPSRCGGSELRDKFNKTSGSVDKWELLANSSLGLGDCKAICRSQCSCDAYTSAYSDGTGCKFARSGKYRHTYADKGDTIYLRLERAPGKLPWKWKLVIGLAVPLLMALILMYILCLMQRRNSRIKGAKRLGLKGDDDQLPFFSLSSIKFATDDFSDAKKLGQGGFGPVYKGKLFNGQEIAVKRLYRISGHGIEQFKNEVVLISKLQHRNLVRLMGYCDQGEERLLVYEYLPNKSLDSILFDATKRAFLDWKARVNIIEGIAQGLLYLHKYSRLKIIHRDLKTSNILLDEEMNPKISDFGTARIFQDHDTRAHTRTIVGTYGYMSPEYAMDGLFSEKSDVFSFGVMVLEIISGKKNTSFYHPDRALNLLGYAWDLWKEERVSDFADQTIAETFSITSGLRYVHIGLLCVQENATDRPTMLDVVSMLMSESTALHAPKQPAFSATVSLHSDDYSENPQPCSINNVTLSDVQGR